MPETNAPAQSEWLTIGEAAAQVGVSVSTLRAWEAAGLSSPERDPRGQRRYSPPETARLREIKRLRGETRLSLSNLRVLYRETGANRPRPTAGTADARIASRLKALRIRLRMTVRQVAEQTGLSASYISSVENGSTRPSVASLQKLTHTYGVTILSLYDDTIDTLPHLIRGEAATTIEMGEPGCKATLLTPLQAKIELHLWTLAPGAGSGGSYQHEGEEFFYVLDGRLGVWLDNREYHDLGPGDCLSFPSTMEHRWINLADTVTTVLGGNTPPTF